MSSLRYENKVNVGAAIAVVLIGIFFAVISWQVNPEADDTVGPRFAPLFLAGLTIFLGFLLGLSAWFDNDSLKGLDDIKEDLFGFHDADLTRVAWVVGVGSLHIILFQALGYFLATLLVFPVILYAFGNRDWLTALWMSVLASIIYQYIFMGLMGLNDPVGELVDASSFTGWFTGY